MGINALLPEHAPLYLQSSLSCWAVTAISRVLLGLLRGCDSSANMLKLFISSLEHTQSFFFFFKHSSISVR